MGFFLMNAESCEATLVEDTLDILRRFMIRGEQNELLAGLNRDLIEPRRTMSPHGKDQRDRSPTQQKTGRDSHLRDQ